MENIEWYEILDKFKKHVVLIKTRSGSGTGFIVTVCKEKSTLVVATARHVIEAAHEWKEPIKIQFESSKAEIFLDAASRIIYLDNLTDFGLILFSNEEIKELPTPDLPVPNQHLKQGVQVAWCGYPGNISPQKLCFFSGHISAWLPSQHSYLVDGVTINGVSGGPAFNGEKKIIGVVTAYIPNRANSTGEAFPGLGVIMSLGPHTDLIKKLEADLIKKQEESKKE